MRVFTALKDNSFWNQFILQSHPFSFFFYLQEDGFIIAESKTGKELAVLAEKGRIFSDGNYHVVRFIRTGSNITLRVDNLPAQSTYLSSGLI